MPDGTTNLTGRLLPALPEQPLASPRHRGDHSSAPGLPASPPHNPCTALPRSRVRESLRTQRRCRHPRSLGIGGEAPRVGETSSAPWAQPSPASQLTAAWASPPPHSWPPGSTCQHRPLGSGSPTEPAFPATSSGLSQALGRWEEECRSSGQGWLWLRSVREPEAYWLVGGRGGGGGGRLGRARRGPGGAQTSATYAHTHPPRHGLSEHPPAAVPGPPATAQGPPASPGGPPPRDPMLGQAPGPHGSL